MLPLTKSKLVNQYKKENDPKVKERLLLIIKVREDKQIPFRVVKELHRSNPWAFDWLKRYDKEGLKELKEISCIIRNNPEYSFWILWISSSADLIFYNLPNLQLYLTPCYIFSICS